MANEMLSGNLLAEIVIRNVALGSDDSILSQTELDVRNMLRHTDALYGENAALADKLAAATGAEPHENYLRWEAEHGK